MLHNIEAEQSAIASVLLDNDCLETFCRLKSNHFYSPAHKIIFEAISYLTSKNIAVDFVTLSERLTATRKMESVGGIEYLTTLTDIIPSTANFKHYISILKKNEVLRRLEKAGNEIINETNKADSEDEALQIAEKLIFDISKENEKKELTKLASELPSVMDNFDTIARDPNALRGVKTGFYALDNITNGFQKSNLIIIGARPSVGKTSLSLNIMLNAALKNKTKVAIFSLEMSKRELATRALCSVARVSLTRATRGTMTHDEWSKLWEANKKLQSANIYVDDTSSITPEEIMRKSMRIKREQGLDMVMVDYLGLMGASSKGSKYDNRQVQVAENSRMMKIMAKELDIPVILLSQLNRGVESRRGVDSEPVLSDLRESGAIEQDADIVMFIHKPKMEGEGEETKNRDYEAKIIMAKHRNGPTGAFSLKFVGEWTTFVNADSNEKPKNAPTGAPNTNVKMPEIVPVGDSDVSDVF